MCKRQEHTHTRTHAYTHVHTRTHTHTHTIEEEGRYLRNGFLPAEKKQDPGQEGPRHLWVCVCARPRVCVDPTTRDTVNKGLCPRTPITVCVLYLLLGVQSTRACPQDTYYRAHAHAHTHTYELYRKGECEPSSKEREEEELA